MSTFTTFGIDLGEGLAAVTDGFRPDRIVLGGQISKAYDLFGPPAEAAYAAKTGTSVPWSPVRGDYVELVGVGHYALGTARVPNERLTSRDSFGPGRKVS